MFSFLFWVIRLQIFIFDFAPPQTPPLVPFSKNMYRSESEISSSFTMINLSIASQLEPGALK